LLFATAARERAWIYAPHDGRATESASIRATQTGRLGPASAVSRAATREAIATVLAQWPDIRFERKRVYIGAGHFVSEYQMSATNAEGQLLVCDGVDVFAVNDGRVARKDTYLDWPALQEQQGAAQVTAISA
jgi:ketosteroid isomerase-like protein